MKVVFQAVKHLIVGAVATLFDLVLFTLLAIFMNSLVGKAISFLLSTVIKYWGNKYWAFQKHGKENIHKEILGFFFITLVGLILDVGFFYYFAKIFIEPIAVIFAAAAAAAWNFLGYKLLVFKK